MGIATVPGHKPSLTAESTKQSDAGALVMFFVRSDFLTCNQIVRRSAMRDGDDAIQKDQIGHS
jgi:hypothetical protein